MRRLAITVTSLALAAASVAATPAVAGEIAPPPTAGKPTVLAGGQFTPLSLAVTPSGGVWFSNNFAGQLMRSRPNKGPVVKYQHPRGDEVGAVSFKQGVVMFATSNDRTGKAMLKKLGRSGRVSNVANLSRYEKRQNPDQVNTYGIENLPDGCQWPKRYGPPSYTGEVYAHPYASLQSQGTTYVADAGGNVINAVRRGVISTVAVLPPMPATITAEAAEANGLPDCVVGLDYHFEPVPTDVEMHDGWLYVTTLPGGPEDPSLGRRGAIHRINPRTGYLETLVTDLLSPTGLAVAPNGDMYVAELFRNRFSRVAAGEAVARKWAPSMLPGDVEFRNGRVWGSRRVLTGFSPGEKPTGQIVRFPRAG
ncbi:ScyD/ScyE family protein [Nocardioides coralli]|uniref:ScyD/ScyE family protein n=1 Tax=Nocardioides coralli TaxID=2872154 RepID=UPI001CA3FED0|nr:ScyD/ScyE family protein [Nocardioides coralli]QZY29924.1 ScyD/ScyE family protein [Nocardioides coralli]